MKIIARELSVVDYKDGVISPRMLGGGRDSVPGEHEAELVERVVGWGESNVLVRCDPHCNGWDDYYLAVVSE